MRTYQLGLILILVAACKGGDKDKGGSSSKSGKGGCETQAAKPADLVTSPTPAFLEPFGKLSLGMARADVAKACPNFFGGDDGKKTGNFSVGEIVGKFGESYAQARLEIVADKLDAIAFSLPGEIELALTKQWGPPIPSTGDKKAHAWFDDKKHIRAILGPAESDGRRELVVSSYMPLDAFIEPGTAQIAWKPQDVLGKQPDDLAKKFPQYVTPTKTSEAVKAKTDEMMKDLNKEVEALGVDTKRNANLPELELPASPYEDGRATKIMLYTDDDGSLRSYGLWFHTSSISPPYGFPQEQAEIVRLLDEKWGPSKTVKETLGERKTWYDAKNGVRASTRIEKPDDTDVTYTRYLPLAMFWGAPNGPWGFEKRPLIGSTPEEVMAAYGEGVRVKRDDTAGTLTLYFPPTDYDGDTAETSILMFVRKGKVGDWRFNIPYGNFDGAKAEYEAALLAKLGKPGKEKYGETPYGKNTKVRFSDITHSLEVIVGEK